MKEHIMEHAMKAANDIADDFTPGYCDARMVEMFANHIAKHTADLVELTVKECRTIYNLIDNGNTVHGTDDYIEALYLVFLKKEKGDAN